MGGSPFLLYKVKGLLGPHEPVWALHGLDLLRRQKKKRNIMGNEKKNEIGIIMLFSGW